MEFVTESKNTTQYSKTNFYPDGIYTNANGMKGHYITKEIENNQGHSKSQRSHSTQKPINWNDTFNSISYYIRYQYILFGHGNLFLYKA